MKNSFLFLALTLYTVSTLISMAAMSVALWFFLFVAVFYFLREPTFQKQVVIFSKSKIGRWYFRASSLLAVSLFIGLVVQDFFPMEFNGQFTQVQYGRDLLKLWYLFLPLVITPALIHIGKTKNNELLKIYLLSFGVLCIVGVMQFFSGWPRENPIPELPGKFHAVLLLGHHLSVASIMIFPWFMSVDLLRSKSIGLSRFVLVLLVVFGILLFALTYARSVWVAIPMGLVVWFFLVVTSWKWRAFFIGLMGLVSIGLWNNSYVKTRLTSTTGVQTRMGLWEANVEFFKRRPLTGTGWHHNLETSSYYFKEKYPDVNDFFVVHAHSNFLEMLGGTGLIGFLAWLFWWAVVFWVFWQLRKQKQFVMVNGLLAAFFVFHVNGATQVNFWESKVLHSVLLMVSLGFAFSFFKKEEIL